MGTPNGSAGGKYGKADVPKDDRLKKGAKRIKLGPLMKGRKKPVPFGKIKMG